MKKFLAIFLFMLVVAGFIFGPTLLARFNSSSAAPGPGGPGGPPGQGRPGASTVFSVRAADAERRTLQAYIEINGNIVSENQVTVVPDAAGRLVSMRTALGATVRRGELIAEIDPSRPGSQYALSPVNAPVSGMVMSNPLSVGSTVSTSTPLLTIASGTSLEIDAQVPEREVGQLSIGLRAEVRLEAFPGEVFQAQIVRISPVVDPASRTKNVVLRFTREDGRINAGMFARLKLNTRSYQNVVSVPQDAVVESRGKHTVFVIAGGVPQSGPPPQTGGAGSTPGGPSPSGQTSRVSMKEVTIGVTVDGETEIRSGINAGEKVVVQGQQFLSDGAMVRVLGTRL